MFEGLFQPMHLLVIFGIALLVFGPRRLRSSGRVWAKRSGDSRTRSTVVRKNQIDRGGGRRLFVARCRSLRVENISAVGVGLGREGEEFGGVGPGLGLVAGGARGAGGTRDAVEAVGGYGEGRFVGFESR